MNEIQLDDYETTWADSVGYYRFWESARKGKTQSDGSGATNGLTNHQRGARAELAAAKYLGLEWTAPVNTYRGQPDLAGLIEVRSKPPEQHYMRVYPGRDGKKQGRVFLSVSVLGSGRFHVDGWIPFEEIEDVVCNPVTNRYGGLEWQVDEFDLHPASKLKNYVRTT